MTDDLVERLRRNATYRDKDWQCIARPSELNEAADRIEMLEKALVRIVEDEDQFSMQWAAEIARTALKGETE